MASLGFYTSCCIVMFMIASLDTECENVKLWLMFVVKEIISCHNRLIYISSN